MYEIFEDTMLKASFLSSASKKFESSGDSLRVQFRWVSATKGLPELVSDYISSRLGELNRLKESPIEVPVCVYYRKAWKICRSH
jgi:hypothetical protein